MSAAVLDKRSQAIQHRHAAIKNLQESQQARENFFGSWPIYVVIGLMFGVSLLFPLLFYITLLVAFVLLKYQKSKQEKDGIKYPLYTPVHSKAKSDPLNVVPVKPNKKDPKAQTRKAGKPEAEFYLGIDPTDGNRQVWTMFKVLKQHAWLQATTGGGKTETIAGMFTNQLVFGSGMIFTDGKADQSLPAKICALSHRFMRSDDVYIVNYITSNMAPWGKTQSERSSTINPFLTGSVSSIQELIKALLQDDGDIWSKRAASFVDALTRVLVYLRDQGEMQFNVSHYGEYLQLEALGRLVGRDDIPMKVKRELFVFVSTLPGLDSESLAAIMRGESLDPRKSTQPLDQLGYCTMQLQPVLNMLSGDYGYIFDVIHGSINVRDIVLKRRIMLVLIPALEKSSQSLQALGQVIVALIHDLLASGIGNQLEGDIDLALKRRFTNDIAPYMLGFDEAGYYFVENAFGKIWAQARSLGIFCLMGSQDNYAMEKGGEAATKEVKIVLSNSNTKLIGKIEDAETTMEQVLARVSEISVYEVKRMDRDMNSISGNSHYASGVELERKKSLEPEDFFTLREGQLYLLHQDRQVRLDAFAAFPPALKNQTSNVLIPPAPLPQGRSDTLVKQYRSVHNAFIERERMIDNPNAPVTGRSAVSLTNDSTLDPIKSRLTKQPSLQGSFLALKDYRESAKKNMEETLAAILGTNPSGRVDLVTDNEVDHAQNARLKAAEQMDVQFEGDESDVVVEEREGVVELAEAQSTYGDAFSTMFQGATELEEQLTVINAESAKADVDLERAKLARRHAQLTVSKIDQALTDYPTPPPAQIDKQQLVATLKKIQGMLE